MPVVIYKPSKEFPPRRGTRSFDGIVLLKGRNEFSDEDLKKLKTHPDYSQFESQGVIEVLPPPPSKQIDFLNLPQNEAIKTIKSEKDPKVLTKYQQLETSEIGRKRDVILNAITLQLKSIEGNNS